MPQLRPGRIVSALILASSLALVACTGGGTSRSTIAGCGVGKDEAIVGNRCVGVDTNNKS